MLDAEFWLSPIRMTKHVGRTHNLLNFLYVYFLLCFTSAVQLHYRAIAVLG